MAAQVLPFPIQPDKSPLAFFVRFGTAHKKLADLFAAGGLPAQRVVVDASRVRFQAELIKTLREDGIELVLDTEIAELSSPRKFAGHVRHSPWFNTSDWRRPLTPSDFDDGGIVRLAGRIAQYAVEHGFATVLSPTHFLNDRTFEGWFDIDRRLCIELRNALDRAGGASIAIDYPAIVSLVELKDVALRGQLSNGLDGLPFENIWIRASGMEGSSGPLKTTHFLEALERFHNVGKPIVADYLGGLAALSALAFGSISGVAHGIAERERFDATDWHLPPQTRGADDEGFGPTVRVEIPYLGKSVTKKELEVLVSAKGGRRICSCADRKCCAHGLDDMMRDPRSHAAYQAFKSISTLEEIPASQRESYLLNGPIAQAVRVARDVSKLKPSATEAARLEVDLESLMRRQDSHSHLLDRLSSALEHLHERRFQDRPRAKPVAPRKVNNASPKEVKR